MAPLRYRVASWLGRSWKSVAGLALLVAVVGGAALTLLAGARRTLTASDRYSESRHEAWDLEVDQRGGAPRGSELRGLPAVADIESATFTFGTLTSSRPLPSNLIVFAGAQGPFGTRLFSGRLPSPARPGEFVASSSFVKAAHAHLGDRYTLITLTTEQVATSGFDATSPAGPKLTATLVGVIDGPSGLEDSYDVALFPATLLDKGDIGVGETVNVVALAPGATQADLRAQLGARPDGSDFIIGPAAVVPPEVRTAVNAQGEGLLALSIVIALAAIVALGQLLGRQLRLSGAEVDALRALGTSRGQLALEPVARALAALVAGTIAAVAIAYAASDRFPVSFVKHVEPHPGRTFDALVLLVGAVVLAAAIAAWVGVAARADDQRSRPAPGVSMVGNLVNAVPSASAATALQLSFGPRTSRTRPVWTSLVGVGVLVATMCGAFVFAVNLRRLVDEPARYGNEYDAGLGDGESEIAPADVAKLKGSHDIGALVLFSTIAVSADRESMGVVGMRLVKGGVTPVTLRGRLPEADDEIALGEVTARELNHGVGDTMTVRAADGTRALHVVGIVLVPSINEVQGVGHDSLVTVGGLASLDKKATYDAAAFTYAQGAPPGAPARVAALVGSAVGQPDPPSLITNFRRIRAIPFALAAAVGALALFSLGHLMVVAVRRRRYELAVLRALGASRGWISAVVQWQATFVSLVVLVLAVPIGAAAGTAVYLRFIDRVGLQLDAARPVTALALMAALALLAANGIAFVPGWRARRVAPARVLAAD